jgi:hypothetical protein
MRELAKSAMSLSWAMSLFGMKQMTNMLNPASADASQSFAPVTKAAVDTFGGTLKTAFQAGDAIQRGAVDLFLGLLSGNGFDLSSFLSPEARQQSVQATEQATAARAAGTWDQGWGPVPPAA